MAGWTMGADRAGRRSGRRATASVSVQERYRHRGLAVWISEMIAAAPRRSCRYLRFSGWQALAQRSAGKGQMVLTADPMWVASVCAVALFHRPIELVVDPARRATTAGLPAHGALAHRWRLQDAADIPALRFLLESGKTVVWVLGRDDFAAMAAGAGGTAPAWARLAAAGASEVLWLRAQAESDDGLRLIVERLPPATQRTAGDASAWVDAVEAQLRRGVASEPLSVSWDLSPQASEGDLT